MPSHLTPSATVVASLVPRKGTVGIARMLNLIQSYQYQDSRRINGLCKMKPFIHLTLPIVKPITQHRDGSVSQGGTRHIRSIPKIASHRDGLVEFTSDTHVCVCAVIVCSCRVSSTFLLPFLGNHWQGLFQSSTKWPIIEEKFRHGTGVEPKFRHSLLASS